MGWEQQGVLNWTVGASASTIGAPVLSNHQRVWERVDQLSDLHPKENEVNPIKMGYVDAQTAKRPRKTLT